MLSDTELTRVVTDEMSAFDVKALIERLADPAILVGPDRIISAANNHVESLFGWEETGLVGQLIDVLIPSTSDPPTPTG
jgi:nitrogen-specific signal transduction histidine kinase